MLSIWKENASKILDLVCRYGEKNKLFHHDRFSIMPRSTMRAFGDKPSGEGVGGLPEPSAAGVGELAVIPHFRTFPEHSLGVVTLNLPQRDLIEEEIDRRLKVYPQTQEYLTQWQNQGYPFFIKNLENVQGDERDVIYISTTYGRRPDGKFVMQFGPINNRAGLATVECAFYSCQETGRGIYFDEPFGYPHRRRHTTRSEGAQRLSCVCT